MGNTGFEHGIQRRSGIEPGQKRGHFRHYVFGHGGLEVHPLAPERARNDLHGAFGARAPGADLNAPQAAPAGRKQGGLPTAQPLRGQGLGKALRSVQQHVDHALHPALRRYEAGHVEAQAPRE